MEPRVTHKPSPGDNAIAGQDDLFRPFYEASKAPSEFRIGAEMEKCGIYVPSTEPVPYRGVKGVAAIFADLTSRCGWSQVREVDDGPVIALSRGGASITLEPGAQLELSGTAVADNHAIETEFSEHMAELAPLSDSLGIAWLGIGFHPFARRDDFEWVPKIRYGIMRMYLPTRGSLALDMMLRTCTVQANYDYTDPADGLRKLRIALTLAPLTTAMFANSPWKEGKPSKVLSHRAAVWLDVDPDRSGLIPSVWKPGATLSDYVEWALDAPMFLFKRDGRAVENTGQTFRSFWHDGYEGMHPTQDDWQMHLNTLFPEVRLKKTLEIRGADAQGDACSVALPALWTGILYDSTALDQAEAMIESWTYDEVAAVRPLIVEQGIRAPFKGKTLQDAAEALLTIAEGGLARRARLNSKGEDERVHLKTLRSLVSRGLTPADVLLEHAKTSSDLRTAVLTYAQLRR